MRKVLAGALRLGMLAAVLFPPVCAGQASRIPHQAVGPVTVEELVQIRGLSGLTVSPDGAHVAIRIDRQDIESNQTILDWWLVRLSDGEASSLGTAGEPRWNVNGYVLPETPQWSPDGAWLYALRLTDQEVQLWRTRRIDGREERVAADDADLVAFEVGEKGEVNYATGPLTREAIKQREDVEMDAGIRLDASIITGFPIAHGFPVNGRMATYRHVPGAASAGRATLGGDAPLNAKTIGEGGLNPAEPWVAERLQRLWRETSGGSSRLDPHGEQRLISPQGQRASSRAIAVQDQQVVASNGDGVDVICRQPLCSEVDDIAVVGRDPEGHLILQTRTFDITRLVRWDLARDVVTVLHETAGVVGSEESGAHGTCQLAGREAVCIAASAAGPPQLVAIDTVTAATRILFNPNPALVPERLGVESVVKLKDRFGNRTYARLLLPYGHAGGQRLPLVLTNYNCEGFLLGGTGRDVPEHVLVGAGFAALCIDLGYDVVQHAPGFEVSQENVVFSAHDFFKDAVTQLDTQGIIDPERVSLNGFSGGATAVTFALTQTDIFTAGGVTTNGSLDPIACYLTSPRDVCASLSREAGLPLPYDGPSGLMRNSPALHVDKIRTPLLMQLAEVEYVPMLQLFSAMRDYGRAVDMYVFPGAYHYKNKPRQRLAVYTRNLDWINFWLLGREAVGKTDQNAQWNELKDRQCRLFAPHEEAPWYC